MEGVAQQPVKDFDQLVYRFDVLDRKAHFDKLKVKNLQDQWKLSLHKEPAKDEKSVKFFKTVESSAAVKSGIYKQVISIAATNTENIFEDLPNTLEISLVATGEAQADRESQQEGIQQRITQEEIISDISRKRLAERNKVSKEFFGKRRPRFSRFGLGRGNYQRSRGRIQSSFNSRFN
ncbi:MAG: hypothetical protein EZS28_015237 [Streblomastix strix]|uniref:Uncharacterized protein n=1 Tax=Streblomastix strix TaxID=222440 RepID=A0A5J4W2U1_9EUKA|nr:MAG: hypothetical protein EZS28_015237 [Streblomastix strix]